MRVFGLVIVLNFIFYSTSWAGSLISVEEIKPSINELISKIQELPTVKIDKLYITHQGTLTGAVLSDNSWSITKVRQRLLKTAAVYLQCGVHINHIEIYGVSHDGQETWDFNKFEIVEGYDEAGKVDHLASYLTESGLTNRPLIVYIEKQLQTGFGVAYPKVYYGEKNKADMILIPYRYEEEETFLNFVPQAMSADYLGEAHELGHLYNLTHQHKSPLMFMSWGSGQQNNQLIPNDCDRVLESSLLDKI